MKRCGCLLALGCAFAVTTFAQKIPDFSGTWELNTAKSKNIGMMVALQDTMTVTQTPLEIVIRHVTSFDGQPGSREVRYDLAGKPGTNEGPMGDRNETVTKWVGDALVTTWTKDGAVAGTRSVMTERCSLSPDKKTMTFESARGDSAPVVMVFERR
jgi:hypothetical protein